MGTTPNIMRPDRFNLSELIVFISNLLSTPGWMVEIGCYQGESTEAFAKSGLFERIFAIDPWSNDVYDPNDKATMHCDMAIVEEAFDERMRPFGRMLVKVKGRSAKKVGCFPSSALDFVYIDADHRYESVKQDVLMWQEKVKAGGVLAGHDYGTHPGIKKAVDEIFGQPHKIFSDYSWAVLL